MPGLYENVALAAAHGYFCVTRQPQAVLVHVDAGTQNLGAMLHDAQRAHAGVLVFAGRTPYTVDGTVPGGRDAYIQWLQDQPDQPGIVRNYVKWSHELGRTDTLNYLVPRAAQIAASEPAGPVYMTVAREVLMAPMDGVTVLPPERTRPAIIGPGDLDGIETIAEWLADAERPLIIAGDVGRHPEAVAHLTELAELVGAPVSDRASPLNIPLTHPLYRLDVVGGDPRGRRDPAARLPGAVDPEADPAAPDGADRPDRHRPGQGVDPALGLPGRPAAASATPRRRCRCSSRRSSAGRPRSVGRPGRPAASGWRRTAPGSAASWPSGSRACAPVSPIHAELICAALGELLPPDAIVIEEAVTNLPAVRRHVRREQPGTLS